MQSYETENLQVTLRVKGNFSNYVHGLRARGKALTRKTDVVGNMDATPFNIR